MQSPRESPPSSSFSSPTNFKNKNGVELTVEDTDKKMQAFLIQKWCEERRDIHAPQNVAQTEVNLICRSKKNYKDVLHFDQEMLEEDETLQNIRDIRYSIEHDSETVVPDKPDDADSIAIRYNEKGLFVSDVRNLSKIIDNIPSDYYCIPHSIARNFSYITKSWEKENVILHFVHDPPEEVLPESVTDDDQYIWKYAFQICNTITRLNELNISFHNNENSIKKQILKNEENVQFRLNNAFFVDTIDSKNQLNFLFAVYDHFFADTTVLDVLKTFRFTTMRSILCYTTFEYLSKINRIDIIETEKFYKFFQFIKESSLSQSSEDSYGTPKRASKTSDEYEPYTPFEQMSVSPGEQTYHV